MASLLQGFEEVQLVKPVGKTVLTVTDSAIRFNKATAEVLGFPAYVKVLINDKTKQIAVTPTTSVENKHDAVLCNFCHPSRFILGITNNFYAEIF